MRAIQRLPEPAILAKKKEEWLNKLLTSGKTRPDSSKYAHKTVRAQLNSMSYHKCFYCEMQLKGQPKEVDHHIEVSVDKTLSYEWENLYLSCDNCNGKIPHSTIPIQDVLDPCRDLQEKIDAHLTFQNEFIQPKNNSELGLLTIQKYRLDTELLDNRRRKQLQIFHQTLIHIQFAQLADSRNALTDEERNILNSFKRKDYSFSRMFEVVLEQYGL